jgi:hypothetical protein
MLRDIEIASFLATTTKEVRPSLVTRHCFFTAHYGGSTPGSNYTLKAGRGKMVNCEDRMRTQLSCMQEAIGISRVPLRSGGRARSLKIGGHGHVPLQLKALAWLCFDNACKLLKNNNK